MTSATVPAAAPAAAVVDKPAEIAAVAPAQAAPEVRVTEANKINSLLGNETKPAEVAAPPLAPYELKPPEGSELGAAIAPVFAKSAHAAGIPKEKAQAIFAEQASALAAHAAKQRETWLKEAVAHPELGGSKLDESVAIANAALSRFASPKLIELLRATSLDVHPEMLAFVHAVGKAVSPDGRFVTGAPKPAVRDRAASFYANMPKA